MSHTHPTGTPTPWTTTPAPGGGIVVRDAHGRVLAVVPTTDVALAIVAAVATRR